MPTCYRHPDRETGVSCSSCGRPICPECMTATPVGMRCPDCGRERTKVTTARSIGGGQPRVTYGLIAINALVFVGSLSAGGGFAERGGGDVISEGALFGPAIADQGEYWRLVTGGFLHAGLVHILFNMYLLYILGGMLEPALGSARFTILYFTALLAGSFGALLVQPDALTVGASGAVFGLMGAGVLFMLRQGIDPMQSGIGILLLLNLLITFVIPGISIGGHLGGLAGGLAAGWLLLEGPRQLGSQVLPAIACVGLAALSVAGSIVVAGGSGV